MFRPNEKTISPRLTNSSPTPLPPHMSLSPPGMRTRFSRLTIREDMCSRLAKAHIETASHTTQNTGRVYNDHEIQDMIGIAAYCDLKQSLAGHFSELTRMSFLRCPDGFFVGMEQGYTSAASCGSPTIYDKSQDPANEVNTPHEAGTFTCEALISVRQSNIMNRNFTEIFIPNAVLQVPLDNTSIRETIQQMSVIHSTPTSLMGAAQFNRASSSSSNNNTCTAATPASNPSSITHYTKPNVATRIFIQNEQNQAIHEIAASFQEQCEACPEGSESNTRATKIDITRTCNRPGSPDTLAASCIIITPAVLQVMATQHNAFVAAKAASIQVQNLGNRVVAHCADCPDRPMNTDRTDRFDVFLSPFPCIVQEHKDGMYVHGMRAMLAQMIKRGQAEGVISDRAVFDPPPMWNEGISRKSLAAAIVRKMQLTTNRPITPGVSHLFEVLDIKFDANPPVTPASWNNFGTISVYPMNGNITDMLNTAINVRKFAQECGVSTMQLARICLSAFALLFSQGADGDIVDLAFPSSIDQKQFHDEILERFKKPISPLPYTVVGWKDHAIEISFVDLDKSNGAAFVFCENYTPFAIACARKPQRVNSAYNDASRLTTAQDDIMSIPMDKANQKTESAIRNGKIPFLTANTMRGAAVRLAYIDALYTQHTEFKPFARTLRAVWLNSEQLRLARVFTSKESAGSEEALREQRRVYYSQMHQLSQLAGLPLGYNYWNTVPYY